MALAAATGIHVDALRLRAPSRSRTVGARVHRRDHDRVFVVEQNRDAQMRSLLSTSSEIARRA